MGHQRPLTSAKDAIASELVAPAFGLGVSLAGMGAADPLWLGEGAPTGSGELEHPAVRIAIAIPPATAAARSGPGCRWLRAQTFA